MQNNDMTSISLDHRVPILAEFLEWANFNTERISHVISVGYSIVKAGVLETSHGSPNPSETYILLAKDNQVLRDKVLGLSTEQAVLATRIQDQALALSIQHASSIQEQAVALADNHCAHIQDQEMRHKSALKTTLTTSEAAREGDRLQHQQAVTRLKQSHRD